ncbi:GNAT family N-acetyltransferase [Thalassomonas actiniarum]|uniref:GNAT family N-acetyltransferase n=1 Tax=Thalassomonas actiniarum TaxID=485447 RepID=A0AAE9YPE3_9GAMM|nr:GNAT family protein [Thalassomonas actiniarum]WDD97773.1 GNAT family N-acetyltransferase [Thalassomonas actiniarum]
MHSELYLNKNFSLSTARLTLVPMTDSHWHEFKALKGDPDLMADIGDILDQQALSQEFHLRSGPWQAEEGQWCSLMIYNKADDDFVGSFGFRIDSKENRRMELGYSFLKQSQGQGYATEAGVALIRFLFEQVKVRKLIAACTTSNIASWKIMEKLSFTREGVLQSDIFINNRWHDSYLYGLVNPRPHESKPGQ